MRRDIHSKPNVQLPSSFVIRRGGYIWNVNHGNAPRRWKLRKSVKLIIVTTTLVHSGFIGSRVRFRRVFVAWCANTGHPWVHIRFQGFYHTSMWGLMRGIMGDIFLMYHTYILFGARGGNRGTNICDVMFCRTPGVGTILLGNRRYTQN